MSRFSEPQDPIFRRLNASLAFDRRLWPYDIAQSRAHARMLAAGQIIADADRDALLAALDAVEAELVSGAFPFADDDEDIHMAIERRVTEIAGPPGGTSKQPPCFVEPPSLYDNKKFNQIQKGKAPKIDGPKNREGRTPAVDPTPGNPAN